MKNIVLTVLGVLLVAGGLFMLRGAAGSQGVLLTLPYLCIGLGCGMFGHASLSNERRTTVCRAIEHAAAASSSVGIRPGFLPPLPFSAILYGPANSKGSKRPELDGLQGPEPRHSDSMLRDENEEARQFRPFRRVRISLLRLGAVSYTHLDVYKRQLYRSRFQRW